MPNVLQLLPGLEGEEMGYVQMLIKDMNETQAQHFAIAYGSRRKDPLMILLVCLVGFLGFAGIHRFILNHIGLGVLFFFTLGLCFIGTIVDLVNHRKLAFEYNSRVAQEIAMLVKQS